MATQTKPTAASKRTKATTAAAGKTTARRRAAAAGKKAAPVKAKSTKPAKAVAARAPAPAPVATEAKAEKAPKLKLVRDSFTMPRSDIALIDTLKSRAVNFKRPAKKSELLRAGLHALAAMGDQQLKVALDALVPLRPGRPRKGA
jgi:hypothetical protein